MSAEPEKRGWRRLLAIAFVTGAIALFSGGFVAGWYVKDLIQASQVTEGSRIVEVPAAETVVEQPMLDVRGMALVDAKQALVDTGIAIAGLKVTEIAWAGAPEVVIAQDPVVGEAIGNELEFQVSVPATMPEVVGKPRGEVVNELKQFGVEVEIIEEYALDKPTGSVLSANVEEGKPLPAIVQMAVAQPGASVYLTQLKSADGRCSTVSADIDGQHFANSLRCSSGDPEPRVTAYLLNRSARQVEGVVGVSDTGATDQKAQVTFVGDGKVLGTATVSYANPTKVSFDTTGILRLEIQVTSPARSEAVLGDFLVKGAVEEIARLEVGS